MKGHIERSVIILGGGGHARVVISALHSRGVNVVGFTDPDPSVERILQVPHLGDDEVVLDYNTDEVVLAQGFVTEAAQRKTLCRWGREQGFLMPCVIHDSGVVEIRYASYERCYCATGNTNRGKRHRQHKC